MQDWVSVCPSVYSVCVIVCHVSRETREDLIFWPLSHIASSANNALLLLLYLTKSSINLLLYTQEASINIICDAQVAVWGRNRGSVPCCTSFFF
jgi:hypothetical protein